MDLMGGLGKLMPKTFTLVVVGAVALCGLPPLNGFVGELLIYLGLFRTMDGGPLQYQWGAVAAPALALVGAIAVATFVKMLGTVFAGVARTETASHGHDPGPAMLAPMGVLATCCLLIGVWPACTFGLLNDAVRQWAPGHIGGAGLQDYVAPGLVLGAGHVAYRDVRRRMGVAIAAPAGCARAVGAHMGLRVRSPNSADAVHRLFVVADAGGPPGLGALASKTHAPAPAARFPRLKHFQVRSLTLFWTAPCFQLWVRPTVRSRGPVSFSVEPCKFICCTCWAFSSCC